MGPTLLDTIEIFNPETYETTYQIILNSTVGELPRYKSSDCRATDEVCLTYQLTERLAKGLKGASGARTKDAVKKVDLTFDVSATGVISNVKAGEGIDAAVAKQLEQALLATSPWTPAVSKGKAIKSTVTLPLMISM